MALDADHRVMPSSAAPLDADRNRGEDAANLFAPISIENRITGNTRVRHQRVQTQLSPGSSYDYGRADFAFAPEPSATPVSEEVTIGYGKSVPATFLKRTMPQSELMGASAPREAAPPQPLPFTAAYANAAATQNATAVQSYGGGFGAPLPFAFTNRMDEEEASPLSDSSAFGQGAQGMGMPFAFANASTAQNADPFASDGPADGDGASPAPKASATVSEAANTEGSAARRGGRRVDRLREKLPPPEPIMEVPPSAEPAIDPWEAMGWKAPEPPRYENTAVWRVHDLTMFERGAFEEPPDPFNHPAESMGMYDAAEAYPYGGGSGPVGQELSAGMQPEAYPFDGGLSPFGQELSMGTQAQPYPATGTENDPYPTYEAQPYDAGANVGYSAHPIQDRPPVAEGAYPYDAAGFEPSEPPAGYPPTPERYAGGEAASPRRAAPPPRARRAAQPQKAPPKRKGFDFASMGPRRAVVTIVCTLAIIFCLVEVGKMVVSLVENEQEMKKTREEFYAMAGVDANKPLNSVELLPEGQTYVPTATPVPAQTPTAAPRIDQNDPLIGVMDNGGATQTTFQAALPTPTTATRTRLAQYPDNALLSISPDFTALRQENPDVVGRLTIDGVLDETFVQRNNTFYLTHNVRGVYGSTGAVFVDESCVLKKPPENLLLRGQTNTQGKLFEPLLQYATAGAGFVAQHGIITCNTVYEQARYVIFAIVRADSVASSPDYFNYAGYPTFQSDAQMMRYVDSAKGRSVYQINVSVKPTDRLLTLATLAEGSDTTNLVILCRMLRNGETNGNIQQN